MVEWGNHIQQASAVKLNGSAPLWTIAVILLSLWLVGIVSSSTVGGMLHLLLPLAVVAYIVSLTRRADA